MHIQSTTLQTEKPIVLTFTDKPITAWGGMSLLAGYARRINLIEVLKSHIAFNLVSPNATNPIDIILAFMSGVLIGARRFAHIESLRYDEVLKQIFGIRRFPSDITIMRFFKRFGWRQIEEVFTPLRLWQLEIMTPPGNYTLDMDSSVFERYGKQEGAVLGYNPKKHRRPSHHPIFAVLAENCAIVHAWLRSGNTASISGAVEFIEETLAVIPSNVHVKTVRADSGFDSGRFFEFLEEKNLRYVVCARFTGGVKQAVRHVKNWIELDSDTCVAETTFQAKTWSKCRRLVLIRQRNRKKDFIKGRELFDDPAYLYQAIFTDMADPPEVVWRFYRDRANVENRIRELKWDYGIDGFCMKKFYATEAAFCMVCFTYNFMQQFQKAIGLRLKRTLGIIRMMVLSCGAEIGRNGKKLMLRLSVSDRRRDMFEDYANRIFHWRNHNCVAVESG